MTEDERRAHRDDREMCLLCFGLTDDSTLLPCPKCDRPRILPRSVSQPDRAVLLFFISLLVLLCGVAGYVVVAASR